MALRPPPCLQDRPGRLAPRGLHGSDGPRTALYGRYARRECGRGSRSHHHHAASEARRGPLAVPEAQKVHATVGFLQLQLHVGKKEKRLKLTFADLLNSSEPPRHIVRAGCTALRSYGAFTHTSMGGREVQNQNL